MANQRPERRVEVPPVLAGAAAWCWRILVVAAAFLALVLLISKLALVVVPFLAAMLISALLHPLLAFLRRRGAPRALATWGTIVIAFAVLGGVGFYVVQQATAQYPQLVNQLNDTLSQLRSYLARSPFDVDAQQLSNLQDNLVGALQNHKAQIASGALAGARIAGEAVTGLILTFFITFFLLDDGDRIWNWVVRLFPAGAGPGIRGAGYRAWHTLSGYIVGTALVATFHGVVIGVALYLLGTPLVLPLAVLVFIGSFIPIVGAVLFGGIAVLVTFITQGPIAGVILLVVLVVENQVEAHLLQPFVVGRSVRLHPLAIALTLVGAGVLAGVIGAIVAVPIVASVNAAVKYLAGREDIDGNPLDDVDRMAPEAPPRVAPAMPYADWGRDRSARADESAGGGSAR